MTIKLLMPVPDLALLGIDTSIVLVQRLTFRSILVRLAIGMFAP